MMTKDEIMKVLDAMNYAISPSGTFWVKKHNEAKQILQAALAEPEGEPATVLRLIDTIKYLVGIAERGKGRKARDDELPEQFVLGYVKRLEAALEEGRVNDTPSAPSEPIGEIVADDMGKPFNAIQIRTHFYKKVPAIGTKLCVFKEQTP